MVPYTVCNKCGWWESDARNGWCCRKCGAGFPKHTGGGNHKTTTVAKEKPAADAWHTVGAKKSKSTWSGWNSRTWSSSWEAAAAEASHTDQQQPDDKEVIAKLRQLLKDKGVPVPEELAASAEAATDEPTKSAGEGSST